MKLRDYLAKSTVRMLTTMARFWRVEVPRGTKKAQLVMLLHETLFHPEALREILPLLTVEALDAYQFLITMGGRFSFHDFCARFGPLRPLTPKHGSTLSFDSLSATEQLAYLGLLFHFPRRPNPRQREEMIIPPDFLKKVATLSFFVFPSYAETDPKTVSQKAADLLTDMTTFLRIIMQRKIHAIYQEAFISSFDLCHLNDHMLRPDKLTFFATEQKSTRVRFIHFLAESGNLLRLEEDQVFKLTSAGYGWFKNTPNTLYRYLWQAASTQTDEQGKRWQRYGYPKAPEITLHGEPPRWEWYKHGFPEAPVEEPLHLLHILTAHLATFVPQQPHSFSDFMAHLWQTESHLWKYEMSYHVAIQHKWLQAKEPRETLLVWGTWLNSAVWTHFDQNPWTNLESKSEQMPQALADYLTHLMQNQLQWWDIISCHGTTFSLTPLGDWLFDISNQSLSSPTSQPITINPKMIITCPLSTPPEHRITLSIFTEPYPFGRYRITPASLTSAFEEGYTFAELMSYLKEITHHQLTTWHIKQLHRWHEQITSIFNEQQAESQSAHLLYSLTLTHALSTWVEHPHPIPDTLIEQVANQLEPTTRSHKGFAVIKDSRS